MDGPFANVPLTQLIMVTTGLTMRGIIEAAGLLLFYRGDSPSFLLMQHADRWDLPKGHAEPGESSLETALRETEEETGIEAARIAVDPDFNFVIEYDVRGQQRGDYRKRVTYFLGYVDERFSPELTEHIGFKWFEWPVTGVIQAATIDPLLKSVAAHLQTPSPKIKPR